MKNSQTVLFIALGVVFWFNAAMLIRYLGTSVFTEGNPKLILFFLLAIPITLVSMYITALVAKLRADELLKPVVIMTTTATFLDGIALTWFRTLYSSSFEVAMFGAALILWGAGLGLLFAYFLENRQTGLK
jgi:Family of unknown function (DUF5367)